MPLYKETVLYTDMVLVDRYIVQRPLGRGGMGAAYLAWDQRLERHCVIKELLPSADTDPSQLEQEAQLLANLQHPNLPEVYRYLLHQGHPLIVMEYIEGETLHQLQMERSSPFEIRDVLEWGCDLLAALSYMHAQRPPVIHRDVKPQNVCITPERRAVLLDFGIARLADKTRTRTSAQAISQGYAPIEQYSQESIKHVPTVRQFVTQLHAEGFRTGPYTDVYGLGATLYFALTQNPPPDAAMRLLEYELRAPQEINPQIPDLIVETVTKALSIHPKDRFQSAAAMLNALHPETRRLPIQCEHFPGKRTAKSISVRPKWQQILTRITQTQSRQSRTAKILGALLALFIFTVLMVRYSSSKGNPHTPTDTGTFSYAQTQATSTASPSFTPTVPPSPTATDTPAPTSTPLSTVTRTITETPQPSPYSFYFTVSAEQLEIRAAPGANYAVMNTVRRGDQFDIVGRLEDGSWWQIDIFGLKHWIPAQLVRPDLAPDMLPIVTPPVAPTVAPLASPTPQCPAFPLGQFETVWHNAHTQTRLGCPIESIHLTGSTFAPFENGFMYWRQDRRLIIVFYNDKTWQEFTETWQPDETQETISPPAQGLIQPIRGFGKIWLEQLGGPTAKIGWAIGDEIGLTTTIQSFEHGVILAIENDTYILYRDDMTWEISSSDSGTRVTPAPLTLNIAFVRSSTEGNDIFVVKADGSNLFSLVGDEDDQAEPDWSPDGGHIVYQSNQAGNFDIWTIDASGQNKAPLTSDALDEREPDWSPDGRQIAYRKGGNPNDDGELWIMDANGENQRPLLQQPVLGRAPVWSPDGRQIAFMSNRNDSWNIYRLDLATGKVDRLTDCSTHCRFPTWSPDGQYIMYNVTESLTNYQPAQVWRVRADQTGTPELFIDGKNPGRPSWSLQGLIVFNVSDGLEIMNADGSDRHALPNSQDGWAPDCSH